MTRFWLVCATCLFLHAGSVPMAMAQNGQGPRMALREQAFDFGKVQEGEVIEHSFKVLNQGNQDLEIVSVKPG